MSDDKNKPKPTENIARAYLKQHIEKLGSEDRWEIERILAQGPIEAFIDKIIIEARPMVDSLLEIAHSVKPWRYRKKLPGAKLAWPQRRKKAVLEHFHENKWDYPLITEKMLEDDNLYDLTPGKERRDFRVKLLTHIIRHWLHTSYPIERLRKKLQGIK